MDITNYEFRSEFMRKRFAEALKREARIDALELAPAMAAELAEGMAANAVAGAILNVLDARGVHASEEIRAQVLACADMAVLTRWLARAATVSSAAEVIAIP
jgi:hypothetical protein